MFHFEIYLFFNKLIQTIVPLFPGLFSPTSYKAINAIFVQKK